MGCHPAKHAARAPATAQAGYALRPEKSSPRPMTLRPGSSPTCMRRLTVTQFISLDGVVQAPGGPEEDPRGGFERGGWVVPLFSEALGARVGETHFRADAFLLGRRTYDIFAAHWPRVTDPADAMAQKLNGAVKHVASRTEPDLAWAHSRWVGADLGAAVRALKAEGEGELQVIGSGNLVQSLYALGLVDELTLWTFPVVLGKGHRLFAEGATPRRMELVESADLDHGVTHRRYRVAGGPGAGSFALE